MPSNLPSSFSRPGASSQQYSPPQQPAPPAQHAALPAQSENSSLYIYISILALIIALASFYGVFFMEKPLLPSQKEALSGIADDLRTLQNRNMEFSAPVSTTIYLDRSYPIKDLFPAEFDIPLEFQIPINTRLIGVGGSGQTISFQVQENVPIKASIPINSAIAFGNNTIRIKKELPVDTKFTSSVSVRAAYGQDLNKIIDKINILAGNSTVK